HPRRVHTPTVDATRRLLPRTAGLDVRRYLLPNLRAVNFVLPGLLGEGVAASVRFDPQAKGLGEWLRSRHADIPVALLDAAAAAGGPAGAATELPTAATTGVRAGGQTGQPAAGPARGPAGGQSRVPAGGSAGEPA